MFIQIANIQCEDRLSLDKKNSSFDTCSQRGEKGHHKEPTNYFHKLFEVIWYTLVHNEVYKGKSEWWAKWDLPNLSYNFHIFSIKFSHRTAFPF